VVAAAAWCTSFGQDLLDKRLGRDYWCDDLATHTMIAEPNQIAARNSRGRLSLDASGFSFALFTFVTGAHPAVRELVR
jgi:hypothetical protein